MRVLLTGATGFVGRALLPRLAARGHEVVPVVRGEAALPGSVRWDLGREDAPPGLPGRIDAVVHAAQSRNYRAFPADGAEMFAVNAAGTAALLDYAARTGATRFCLLSTGTVYDPFRHGLDEDAPLEPTSMLGASKLAAEVIARAYSPLFPISILRIFTPYGPGQTARLIPTLYDLVQNDLPIQLPADGEGMRLAPIYIDDLCGIIERCLEEGWRDTLNVASPFSTTIKQITELIGSILDRNPKYEIASGTSLNLVPPISRLGARYDLQTFISLKVGLSCLASKS